MLFGTCPSVPGVIGQVDTGLECESLLREIIKDVGCGLIGLHLKGMFRGELFTISEIN